MHREMLDIGYWARPPAPPSPPVTGAALLNTLNVGRGSWFAELSSRCASYTHTHTHIHTRTYTHTYTHTHMRAGTLICASDASVDRVRNLGTDGDGEDVKMGGQPKDQIAWFPTPRHRWTRQTPCKRMRAFRQSTSSTDAREPVRGHGVPVHPSARRWALGSRQRAVTSCCCRIKSRRSFLIKDTRTPLYHLSK